MDNQNKYMYAIGAIALVGLGIYFFTKDDKPKGVSGLFTENRLPGKTLAASQVLQLMDKDWDYAQALKMTVRENTKGMSANKSKQFKRKLEKELNKYI